MNLYPFKLSPVAKSAIWGGERLRRDWHKHSDLDTVAETWELTVREKENNTIQNGPFAGKTLADVLKNSEFDLVGSHSPADRFPLLVKFIDAADRLSVQVHPDDAFAAELEGDVGKTEMWYVVDADEGATILYGLVEGATAEDLKRACAAGDPEPLLNRIKVQKGDCFFIPAGMPHAIGKGILIAEIQQNCDLTYRLFDYNRRDKNGNLRELHTEKAVRVTKPFTQSEVDAVRYAKGKGDTDLLANCPYFAVRHASFTEELTLTVTADSFYSLLFLEGAGDICANGHTIPFQKGDSFFLPAELGACILHGRGEVLISTL